ncbi:MAG: hypothetical protein JWM06_1420 [Actinomycetia bacterium]|jgi:hypothetical protein|nr:hypothetical protein [Actinomycetes bacterium]
MPFAVRSLAKNLARQVPQPLDPLELAAVIESMGITDAVALEQYDTDNGFALAERVFPLVHARAADHHESDTSRDVRYGEPLGAQAKGVLESSAGGLVALAPFGLLVGTLQVLAQDGWDSGSLLALSLGVVAAMLLTSGPGLAIGVRAATYAGLGYRATTRRFVEIASLSTVIGCWTVAALVLAGQTALSMFDPRERLIFSSTIAVFAAIWLLVASMTFVGRPLLAVWCLVIALLLGVALGAAEASYSLGLAVALATAIVALLSAWVLAGRNESSRPMRLPPTGRILVDAAPYAAFGGAFALLLLEPHLLGWFGRSAAGRLRTLNTFELSLNLALVPLLSATVVLERISRSFWRLADQQRHRDERRSFSRALDREYRARLLLYTGLLASLSLAAAAAFEVTRLLGALGSASSMVFFGGLAGFFLIGIGQFVCLVLLGFSLPAMALTPLAVGIAVLTITGIPAALIDFRAGALAFPFGAAAFCATALTQGRRVLRSADYHYATAF